MSKVMVLGGYGAVGRHAAGVLVDAGVDVVVAGRRRGPAERLADELDAEAVVVDAADPAAVGAAAEGVDAVVDCAGRESVELAEAVLRGGAHLVDVTASHAYHQAVRARVEAAGDLTGEVLVSVGLTPGLTNLLAVEVASDAPGEPIDIVAVIGAGEDHGRAARDWSYSLFGRHFADTTGGRSTVRNFTGRQRRVLPHVGPCWVYRVDLSDQHALSADLGRPVVTRLGTDSRLVTGVMASASALPGAARALRAVEPAVPWSWLGTDRWVVAAGSQHRIDRWVSGREEGRGTGVVAGLAAVDVLDAPGKGVTHLHERTTLAALAPQLARYGIEANGA